MGRLHVLVWLLAIAIGSLRADEAFNAGQTETIPSSTGKADCSAVLVWAHGLGDTHRGWSATMKVLHGKHPHVCFVLPTAPMIPIKVGNGRRVNAWYDFDGTEWSNHSNPGDTRRISRSAKYLQKIAQDTAHKIGVEGNSRVVIGGFSQGGVVSYHAGLLTQGGPFAGVVAVGAYLPAQELFMTRAVRGARTGGFSPSTPVLALHGSDDDRIPLSAASQAKDQLATLGVEVDLKTFPKMGHGMNDAMLAELSRFIERVLPADEGIEL
jgi:predicted esterase